ncbi:hypothetical protein ONA91_20390 [Micromonospora sp. DR5-3]|uniref:hypothetical protein n=1 Tax=unclassified Micromonospora TaxID=2617518 RepID=UPI0011D783F1|nr:MULTISPECIES: hypothetical protein [unclassified Micromonospora]MCW3816809.1 hypothetical protein [Micromonospora sp. DR5-3]TYC23713.1 hypothetical protein FXF52_14115 [Micromonospora sp. MP36]
MSVRSTPGASPGQPGQQAGVGGPGVEVEGDDRFQAAVHGYGFSTDPQFQADEFRAACAA